jgi:CheY-like chemotaxis protein
MDNTVRLIEASADFLGVLIWPLIVVFVLIRFGPPLGAFFADLSEFTLKGAGFEASAKRKAAEAAAATAAAVLVKEAGPAADERVRDARAAAAVVAESVTSRSARRAEGALVLWVDDRPDNNIHEREALEAMGIGIVLATSTEEALEKVKQHRFEVIISDMGRPNDSEAGYTLLDRLRAAGNRTPYIIYAGSRAPEYQATARQHGALGTTNRPDELFRMVLSALAAREPATRR